MVHPVQGLPPHCPYFATVHPVVEPVDVVAATLVDVVLELAPLDALVVDDAVAVAPVYEAPVVVPTSTPEHVAPADFVVPPE